MFQAPAPAKNFQKFQWNEQHSTQFAQLPRKLREFRAFRTKLTHI